MRSAAFVKIAPGEDAKYWDDCLRDGYICVGWDEVGDLREFPVEGGISRASSRRNSPETYNNHKPTLSKKANEVWTLMELEPGDIVIANKGTSQVLAVGKVAEPGISWKPERRRIQPHGAVSSGTRSYAKEIPPQKRWALVTVAPVPAALSRPSWARHRTKAPDKTSW